MAHRRGYALELSSEAKFLDFELNGKTWTPSKVISEKPREVIGRFEGGLQLRLLAMHSPEGVEFWFWLKNASPTGLTGDTVWIESFRLVNKKAATFQLLDEQGGWHERELVVCERVILQDSAGIARRILLQPRDSKAWFARFDRNKFTEVGSSEVLEADRIPLRVLVPDLPYVRYQQLDTSAQGGHRFKPPFGIRAKAGTEAADTAIRLGLDELERPVKSNFLDGENTLRRFRYRPELKDIYPFGRVHTQGKEYLRGHPLAPDTTAALSRQDSREVRYLTGLDSEHCTLPEVQAYGLSGVSWFAESIYCKAECMLSEPEATGYAIDEERTVGRLLHLWLMAWLFTRQGQYLRAIENLLLSVIERAGYAIDIHGHRVQTPYRAIFNWGGSPQGSKPWMQAQAIQSIALVASELRKEGIWLEVSFADLMHVVNDTLRHIYRYGYEEERGFAYEVGPPPSFIAGGHDFIGSQWHMLFLGSAVSIWDQYLPREIVYQLRERDFPRLIAKERDMQGDLSDFCYWTHDAKRAP